MAHGVVTQHLFGLIARQVAEHSLVVWYDPDESYSAAVADLTIAGTTVARYDGSFFALRKEIDHLMQGERPPRLVVYVPRAQEKSHHALIELEAAGVVMQPAQQPPGRNTKLSLVARNALKPLLGDDAAEEVEKQVEAGKLNLADLNALADKGHDLSRGGVLSILFGTGGPQEVALGFLTSPGRDDEIVRRAALPELLGLVRFAFGLVLADNTALPEVRERLSRYILLTDLLNGLGGHVPPTLASVPVAQNPAQAVACEHLAQTWRLRRDLRDSYVDAATRAERECDLAQVSLPPKPLEGVETFLAGERALQRHVETALLDRPDEPLLRLAQARLSRFWSEAVPQVQAHWALIVAAAEVLLAAERLEKALKKPPTKLADLIGAYADGDSPWCLLDTHHRHLESRWFNFDPDQTGADQTLDKLLQKARQRYTEVASALSRLFVGQVQKTKHPAEGVLRQVEVFESLMRPRLAEEKVAYVWVDALRFEMARELCQAIAPDFQSALQPGLATAPTITEVGMASLLPKANGAAKVVNAGGGKLALEIGGTLVRDRKERIAFLKAHAGVAVFDAKLDELLPKPKKGVREGIQGAQLVLITSQEIDEFGERDQGSLRRHMDGVLNDLRRGFRVLTELGVRSIILAADHGHLFGEEINEDMKIDAPGGETADLHRRAWVGHGGASEPSYLRMPLASLGVASDLDIATPWTFACFRVKGGARAYFHGGLSPQEMVIPVAVLTPLAQKSAVSASGITWRVTTGSKKLSTRFFSVRLAGTASGLFGLEPPKVRLEIRAKGKCISQPVSASYGFEDGTGDVVLRASETEPRDLEPNTVTLMLVEDSPSQKTVSVVVLDAASGVELATLDKIEVAISM